MRKGTGPRLGTYYPKHWNMALTRDVAWQVAFQKEGEEAMVFDESLMLHGDVDLGKRIASRGMKIIFSPEIVVEHSRETSVWSFARNNYIMAGTCRTLGIQRLPHVVLASFVIAVLAVMMLSAIVASVRLILIYGGILYGSLLIAEAGIGLKRTKNVRVACLIPLLLFILHWTRGIGYLFPVRRKSSKVRL